MREMIDQLSARIIRQDLRPARPTVFALENIVEAFDALVERRHTGRMLIRVTNDA
jgi:NADPH:quinone reductase-like Zn-dependent oxidoreductase